MASIPLFIDTPEGEAKSFLEKTPVPSKVLGVLLPGVGYSCDRPLLYYTGRLLQENNCDLLRVDYGPGEHGAADIASCTESALRAIEKSLVAEHTQVILVGKSYGTVIGGKLMHRLRKRCSVRMLLYTPLKATLPYMNGDLYLGFSGTADPYLSPGEIESWFGEYDPGIIFYTGANHSLEVPFKTFETLDILHDVLIRAEEFLFSAQ